MSILTQDYFYKVALIGDSSVGKSSLLKRFADDHFEQTYHATIGVDFKFKTLEINKAFIKLQIWDTAGQQRFRTITSAYYKNAQGVIVTFDINNNKTFESIQNYWLKQIRQYGQEGVQIIMIGSKVDTSSQKNSLKYKISQFQAKHHIKVFLCSAKTGQGVKQAFIYLTKLCIDKFGSMDSQINERYKFLQNIKKKKSEFQLKSGIQNTKREKKGCC